MAAARSMDDIEAMKKKLGMTYELGSVEHFEDIIHNLYEIAYIVRSIFDKKEYSSEVERMIFWRETKMHLENLTMFMDFLYGKIAELKAKQSD